MNKKNLIVALFAALMVLTLSMSFGTTLAAYPGPDEVQEASNWAPGSDIMTYVVRIEATYYQGLAKYNNVHFYHTTWDETYYWEPYDGATVRFYADNWDTGWYTFPGLVFDGEFEYSCDGYNVNSLGIGTYGYQNYVHWDWWTITDATVVGAYAYTQASW